MSAALWWKVTATLAIATWMVRGFLEREDWAAVNFPQIPWRKRVHLFGFLVIATIIVLVIAIWKSW